MEKTCTCNNGDPAIGIDCDINGKEVCTRCDEGYYLDNGICKENICECGNGVPARGAQCPEHGQEKCIICRNGYYLDTDGSCKLCGEGKYIDSDGICVQNECKCTNGEAKSGSKCKIDKSKF